MLLRSEVIGSCTVRYSRGVLRYTAGLRHSENDQPAVEKYMRSLCNKNDTSAAYADPQFDSANKGIWYLLWYKHGHIHRAGDMPAIIDYASKSEHWYVDGVKHRDSDKPALMTTYGNMHWYVNGLSHRVRDRPSYINHIGEHAWYIRGQSQRLNPHLPVKIDSRGVSVMADGRESKCDRLWRITSQCVRKLGDPWYVSSLAPDCTCATGACKNSRHAMWCDCGHPKCEHIDTNVVVCRDRRPEMECTCGKCS